MLQRIAICYLAVVAIWLTTGVRGQLVWIVGLSAVYWGLMTIVPLAGFGAGNLGVDGNVAHYVDTWCSARTTTREREPGIRKAS